MRFLRKKGDNFIPPILLISLMGKTERCVHQYSTVQTELHYLQKISNDFNFGQKKSSENKTVRNFYSSEILSIRNF